MIVSDVSLHSISGKLHISGLMEMLELQLHGEDGSFGLQDHESSSNMNIEIESRLISFYRETKEAIDSVSSLVVIDLFVP